MQKRKSESRNIEYFGIKCVLLAVAILLIAGTIVFRYMFPSTVSSNIHTVISVVALIIIALVMVFEIRTYLQLRNTGIRSIYREKDVEIEKFGKFNRLIENNLFMYNFQPIVDAKSGEIFAYESLMRSPSEIGLFPRDILKYADISQQLYSIEFYTFFNSLRFYHENQDKFGGRKLFINSIPSITLSQKDLSMLIKQYGDITKNTVVEILENDDDTDESCCAFERIRELFGCQIAIDDYGSGYSNESKLINNNPNFIKIDISLISSIDSDMKKQLLVSNIIKFASKYDIKVLAEGVETKEELKKLIELGVDFVQGFYIARPSEEILQEIPEETKDYIIEQNIRFSRYDNDRKIYNAADGEKIKLLDAALEKYAIINVAGGEVTLIGEQKHTIDMKIRTQNKSECRINLENVNLKGFDGATIQVGENAKLTLNVAGESNLHKEGIYVPGDSALHVCGVGNLNIYGNRNNGAGIGAAFTDEFGSIIIDVSGSINVVCSGDRTICIGGGCQAEKAAVRLLKGNILVKGSGIKAIGIGAANGKFTFMNTDANVTVEMSGNEVIGIGGYSGEMDIVSSGVIYSRVDGDKLAGVGSYDGGTGRILLTGGNVHSEVHGLEGVCIGSLGGAVEVVCGADMVNAYGEGTKITGIGNGSDLANVTVSGGTVISKILAAEANCFGNEGRNLVITGGNVISNPDAKIEAENSFGEALKPIVLEDEISYEKHIVTPKGDYVYRAERADGIETLRVFIPEECEIHEVAHA